MRLTKEIRDTDLLVRTDSQLIAIQIKGDYHIKDPLLLKYLQWAMQLSKGFNIFEVSHIPQEENANLLARLAST